MAKELSILYQNLKMSPRSNRHVRPPTHPPTHPLTPTHMSG